MRLGIDRGCFGRNDNEATGQYFADDIRDAAVERNLDVVCGVEVFYHHESRAAQASDCECGGTGRDDLNVVDIVRASLCQRLTADATQ